MSNRCQLRTPESALTTVQPAGGNTVSVKLSTKQKAAEGMSHEDTKNTKQASGVSLVTSIARLGEAIGCAPLHRQSAGPLTAEPDLNPVLMFLTPHRNQARPLARFIHEEHDRA